MTRIYSKSRIPINSVLTIGCFEFQLTIYNFHYHSYKHTNINLRKICELSFGNNKHLYILSSRQSHLFLSHSYCRFCEKMSSLKSGEELKRRVLSIQSHVIHGYVGNKSATFPLQVSGYDKFNFEMQ